MSGLSTVLPLMEGMMKMLEWLLLVEVSSNAPPSTYTVWARAGITAPELTDMPFQKKGRLKTKLKVSLLLSSWTKEALPPSLPSWPSSNLTVCTCTLRGIYLCNVVVWSQRALGLATCQYVTMGGLFSHFLNRNDNGAHLNRIWAPPVEVLDWKGTPGSLLERWVLDLDLGDGYPGCKLNP